ncbi:tetratricopeptide repeat-containing sensor histidine kinase [Hufsiella ginkgonis]|uniref:histidine kinase n=1 Tax=Hufsiella ginkgonis TaxID=2695274 RepID=A0A7K1Y0N4_9SPHI|nr:HAMP domain-containing sensor histidine kinase [Hufsiella ginkgonis]MXV16795.1 tetratricopeptide repeat protein [Hufsiella ginkgonis]
MRSVSSSALLCFIILSTCGQANHPGAGISRIDSAKIRLYEQKSISYQITRPDSAVYFAGRGLKLARSRSFLPGEAVMLGRLARINEQYGNLALAANYQREALAIVKRLPDTAAATAALSYLGLLEGRLGNLSTGKRLVKSALTRYRQRKDTTGMVKTYTLLGELDELGGKTSDALANYVIAEKLNKGAPLTDDYFKLIGKLGNLHTRLGEHQKALTYYQAGISASKSLKDSKVYIDFLHSAGKAWDSLGNKQQALAYHRQGLQEARNSGTPEQQARSLLHVGISLRDQDADQSIGHLKNALQIARDIGNRELSSEIYRSLASVYRQQSRYLEALNALEHHHQLLDSLENAAKGHKIAVLQSSYEAAEARARIENLELVSQRSAYQRNAWIASFAVLLTVLLLMAFYFSRTRRLNKLLAASNQVKDKLFTIIGHDLRNPIGGITQLLAIMEEEHFSPEEHQSMVSEMRKQGDVTLEILNALLNWGEAQLKGIHIKPSLFKAETSIRKNIEALSRQAEAKSIAVKDLTPPGLMVYGDANHFDFIVRNLLSNAIKFSRPSGMIEIAADRDSEPGTIIFSVRDYGKGISKVQQELFLKANLDVSFGTSGEKGTGIGLMLCKEFIKANQGRLWIESEEGEGATFFFTFLANAPAQL